MTQLVTALSDVDGQAGRLTIAGFPLEELAGRARFEEVAGLLWTGEPEPVDLSQGRELPSETRAFLAKAARQGVAPMAALRLAAAGLELEEVGPAGIVGRLGAAAGVYGALLAGREPGPAREDLSHAGHFLWLLGRSSEGRGSEEPNPAAVRALDTYLTTVVDHGFNASTYTARVIASTGGTDLAAVTGALGALEGPLHGGAPGPALDMVFEIGEVERAEPYLRAKLGRGERLMGFGHRVYRVRDPRADVLAAAARELEASTEDRSLFELARGVEEVALRLLAEHKPDRRLDTNVEYYTALLLHALGIDRRMFSAVFAVSRVVGWLAHVKEQRQRGRLIRPDSTYDGPRGRTLATSGRS